MSTPELQLHGPCDEVRVVAARDWLDELTAARRQGHGFLDHIMAVDEIGRADEIRVIARVVDFSVDPVRGLQLQVRLPREDPRLPSASGIFRGASWHEREVHDFFGVVFDGGDGAPLLNHTTLAAPLCKDVVLAARAAQPWPGSKEPGEGAGAPSRRKMAPPGVPDESLWGDRDPAEPEPSAEEIAAAVVGGRVRRRR